MDLPRDISLAILFVLTLTSNVYVADSRVEVVHVGCFASSFADSHHYYQVKSSLTWDQGVQACSHRLTTHMAVRRDGSSPEDNIFYCGNDLLLHSEPLDSTLCQPCAGSSNYRCGGLGSVSLYKLRESTPFAVLIAAEGTGVLMLREEDDIPILNTLVTYDSKMWDMDYYYEEDEIWFSYKNDTYRSAYNPVTSKYIAPRSVPTCGKINRSPNFDWVRNRAYYGCDTERKIYELDLSGNVIKTYEPKIDRDMRDLAIDPYRRLAFFSTWGLRVFSYSLDDGKLVEFQRYGKLFLKGKVMCMDHHEQNLYVIGELDGESEKALVRVNYQDTKASILYKGPEISDPWRMDYFNGTIVWSNYDSKDSSNTAYKCTLTPKCRKENLKVIFIANKGKAFSDIKIYHPLKQTPDRKGLCDPLKCSHFCSKTSLFSAKCGCPKTMRLTADNRTCTAECPPLRYPSLDIRCVYRNKQTSCDRNVRPGTTATPSCKQHYSLQTGGYHSKHTQITCLARGEWSSQPLECTPECGGINIVKPLISNGQTALRGEVPWQAGLYMRKMPDGRVENRWQLLCGGTLISSHLVLTAAHCVKYNDVESLSAGDVKVGLGKLYKDFYNIEPSSVIADVREVLLPPHYSGSATAYIQDIAILDLVRVVHLSEYIMPACVDWQNLFKMSTGETVYVAGWGKTEAGTASETLQTTRLTLIETNDCFDRFSNNLKRFITPDKFCAETNRDSQVQSGDSGGGMTALNGEGRHFVIGVVSTKVPGDSVFSMFTNISNVEHFSWLEQQRARLAHSHQLS